VKLGAHAFMAYDLPPAQQLIRDISDVYFPIALKDDHPDGVPMRVLDRTEYAFDTWLQSHAPSDRDLIAAGSRLAPAGVHTLNRLGNAGDFLSRLPEKIVKDGRICQQGGSVSSQGACVPLGERDSSEEVSVLHADRAPDAPVARLQVKMEGGERVVLHMEPSHSIGDLEDALASWREGHGLPDASHGRCLQLRTAFPRKVHSDRSQTLVEAGLTPSASLFVGAAEA